MSEISQHSLPEHLQSWAQSIEIDEPTRRIYCEASALIVQDVFRNHVSEDSSIVEIGCGTGELRAQVNSIHSGPYIQMDQSEQYLSVNRFYNPESQLVRATIDNLPVADGSRDVVTGLNVLDVAMGTPPNCSEVFRVLKPGGTFIHFHDRRPYIPFLISNVPEDEIPFVWVDDGMQGFQLVERERFAEKPIDSFTRFVAGIRRDPHMIETARGFMPGLLDFQSDRVSEVYGDDAFKIGFGNLFTQQARRLLESAGLEVEYAAFDTASVELNMVETKHAAAALGLPYRGENTLAKNRNGVYRFRQTEAADGLSNNNVRLDFNLSVLVARKPL